MSNVHDDDLESIDPVPDEAAAMPAMAVPPAAGIPIEGTPLPSRVRRLRRRPALRAPSLLVLLSAVWLAIVIALSATANILPLKSPVAILTTSQPREAPAFRWPEPLGTDNVGRSVLSRVIFGARESLLVAFGAVGLGLVVGSLLGMAAGFRRGKFDGALGLGIDFLLAFPALVLLMAIAAFATPSVHELILALALLLVPGFARLSRAGTLSTSQQDFVLSARVIGATNRWILLRDIMPNIIVGLITYGAIALSGIMVAEGTLSFLGLGIPPPAPSWGSMISAGVSNLQDYPFLVFVPAIALLLTVLALNLVGDWLRERFAA
jgi:peptide/nickel transport system permease protein